MKSIRLDIGTESLVLSLPPHTKVLRMQPLTKCIHPSKTISQALTHSLGSVGLEELICEVQSRVAVPKAVIVISDTTRPVPYKGEAGILWPVVERLLKGGILPERICILVANGTHRPLEEKELRAMLDPRVFQYPISLQNHDCKDREKLTFLGNTKRGTKMEINSEYLQADIKILTGLVESHFMAGFSGGRKSICPGLMGVDGTYVFHGAEMLDSPYARSLQLEGNPCHEEAVEVALKAGADYIVNVTLDRDFNLHGVFAGDLLVAHEKAVEAIRPHVGIPLQEEYDIVVVHAGFVGVNHYQGAKAALAALSGVKKGGRMILVANNTDSDPIGSTSYRKVLRELQLLGAKTFIEQIKSRDWEFVPEQWQVQMYARVGSKIPMEHFVYYSPCLSKEDYALIPQIDGNIFLEQEKRYGRDIQCIPEVVTKALETMQEELRKEGKKGTICYLADGPYGVLTTP